MIEKVAVLDFGSQYTHLIARRIRELNVYAEVKPYDVKARQLAHYRGIILSGGPWSVFEEGAPEPDEELFELGIPVLGICYGLQIIGKIFGGKVDTSQRREYGRMEFLPEEDKLFKGISSETLVWMSHGDRLMELPDGFESIGKTNNSEFAAIKKGDIYGLQFHPEVTHTISGKKILENFLFYICDFQGGWTAESFTERARDEIKSSCERGNAVLAYSGGVDSTVCSVLAKEILGGRFTPIYVDTGLMRSGETEEIRGISEKLSLGVKVVEARKRFLSVLDGVSEPEEKRMVIGREFAEIFEEEAEDLNAEHLIQGTLYPDRIESVSDVGPSKTIKTHHNVGALPEDLKLNVVEPLKDFFKDEVRKIAGMIGIPERIYRRHPFPGPGLAVRILGEVTNKRLETLRKADKIFIDSLREMGLYDSIWQAFAVFIPVRTVGVMGDHRTYGNLIGLRAVTSEDGMTADWFHFEKTHLDRIARRIMNEVKGINRVVYDISSKPPATIEWE